MGALSPRAEASPDFVQKTRHLALRRQRHEDFSESAPEFVLTMMLADPSSTTTLSLL